MLGNKLVITFLSLLAALFLVACQMVTPPESVTSVPPTSAIELPTPSAVPPPAAAERQTRILFIGDSFILGLNEIIEDLAASADPKFIIESREIANGGMSLFGHWFSPQTVPLIQEGSWTIVVLQEDLAIEGLDVQKFYEYTRKFDAEIKRIGAETILYMPWEYDNDNPIKIEQIASAYRDMGTELGVKVAPAGLAWSRSIAERPALDLYGADRVHASEAGTLLTVAVLYITIFGESPEGFPAEELQLSKDDIAFLQRIAWETVVDFQQ